MPMFETSDEELMQIESQMKDTPVFLKPVIWIETEITMQLVDACSIEKPTTGVLPCRC